MAGLLLPFQAYYNTEWRGVVPEEVRWIMTAQTKALFDAALALPEAERAILADRLWDSVSLNENQMSDDQLFAELERRHAEAENDPSVTVPWSELRKEE
jgi:putative addiction module component (TIGR02574 family)